MVLFCEQYEVQSHCNKFIIASWMRVCVSLCTLCFVVLARIRYTVFALEVFSTLAPYGPVHHCGAQVSTVNLNQCLTNACAHMCQHPFLQAPPLHARGGLRTPPVLHMYAHKVFDKPCLQTFFRARSVGTVTN